MVNLTPHPTESVSEAAIRLARDYNTLPEGTASELARVLEEAKAQRHAVHERLWRLQRLSELKRNVRSFFKGIRSAAVSLQEPMVSDLDREIIADELLRACLTTGTPALIAIDCPEGILGRQHFQRFISAILDFAATSNAIEKTMLEHDGRQYREVRFWNYCLDGVFLFWTATLGRSIENSFEKRDGPNREEGEPISRGARFIAECMLVIDAPGYRAERLKNLLDRYRQGELGREGI